MIKKNNRYKKRTKIGKFHTVYRGPIYEVQQARAENSNGKQMVFEQIVRPDGAAVIPIDRKGRVLLAREYRQKVQRYSWVFPGGRGEKGERPKSIAEREIQEEIGMMPNKLKLFHVFRFSNTLAWKDYYFLGGDLVPSFLPDDEDEDIRVQPVTFKQAFQMVLSGEIENPKVAFIIIKLYRLRTSVARWARSSHLVRARFT